MTGIWEVGKRATYLANLAARLNAKRTYIGLDAYEFTEIPSIGGAPQVYDLFPVEMLAALNELLIRVCNERNVIGLGDINDPNSIAFLLLSTSGTIPEGAQYADFWTWFEAVLDKCLYAFVPTTDPEIIYSFSDIRVINRKRDVATSAVRQDSWTTAIAATPGSDPGIVLGTDVIGMVSALNAPGYTTYTTDIDSKDHSNTRTIEDFPLGDRTFTGIRANRRTEVIGLTTPLNYEILINDSPFISDTVQPTVNPATDPVYIDGLLVDIISNGISLVIKQRFTVEPTTCPFGQNSTNNNSLCLVVLDIQGFWFDIKAGL